MWLTKEQSLAKFGTEAYTGWQEKEAQADWNAKGASSSSPTNTGVDDADSILSRAIDPIDSMLKASRQYEKENPFNFDEQLAQQAATAEYAPYWSTPCRTLGGGMTE